MPSYDPRYIVAKFPGVDMNGVAFNKGERVLYYPNGKQFLAGEAAAQAWRDFQACKFDESMMTGNW